MSLLNYEMEPEDAISEYNNFQSSVTTINEKWELLNATSPIEVDDKGIIHFHPKIMVKDQYYPFKFNEKEFLIKKTKANVIDFYEFKK